MAWQRRLHIISCSFAYTNISQAGLCMQLAAIIRAVRTSSLQKAEEKRTSMALDRATHKRGSSTSTDSGRQLLGQVCRFATLPQKLCSFHSNDVHADFCRRSCESLTAEEDNNHVASFSSDQASEACRYFKHGASQLLRCWTVMETYVVTGECTGGAAGVKHKHKAGRGRAMDIRSLEAALCEATGSG